MLCPGAKAQFAALELPQVPAVSVGSLEDAVLAQTAEELSRTLEERCLSEAGCFAQAEYQSAPDR
mgnify:CR=1 FL=1